MSSLFKSPVPNNGTGTTASPRNESDSSLIATKSNDDPFEVAARRTRQTVQPEGGRQFGRATVVPEAIAAATVVGFANGMGEALTAGPRFMGDYMEGRLDPDDPETVHRALQVAATTIGAPFLGGRQALRAVTKALPEVAAQMPGLTRSVAAATRTKLPISSGVTREGAEVRPTPKTPTSETIAPQNGSINSPAPAFPNQAVSGQRAIASGSDRLGMNGLPRVAKRPFSADYPNGARTDAQGKLLTDMEGRPLEGQFIVGRNYLNEPDRALSPEELSEVARQLGVQIKKVKPEVLPAGASGVHRATELGGRRRYFIDVRNDLDPAGTHIITAHELGHALDDMLGFLENSLEREHFGELRKVYATSHDKFGTKVPYRQPDDLYPPSEVPGELIAEGFRAYKTNPNYFKTVAPKTAAAFRDAVYRNETLRKIFQFNTVAGAAAIGSGALGVQNEDR